MTEQNTKSNPGVAAVLSFVFSGVGQLYNGQIKKGLLIIACAVSSIFILIIGSLFVASWILRKTIFGWELPLGIACSLLGLVLICILAIYSITDAYQTAARK